MNINLKSRLIFLSATKLVPPFVDLDTLTNPPTLTGYSTDYMKYLVDSMGITIEWKLYETVPEILEAVANNDSDCAIAAISVTSARYL